MAARTSRCEPLHSLPRLARSPPQGQAQRVDQAQPSCIPVSAAFRFAPPPSIGDTHGELGGGRKGERAMLGLALMAHKLAVQRTGRDGMSPVYGDSEGPSMSGLYDREYWLHHAYNRESSTTHEYYRIIERLERGEKP
jgi:hypothetical protein